MIMNKLVCITFVLFFAISNIVCYSQTKTVMFDLSHGQCKDIHPNHEYYTDITSDYANIVNNLGANIMLNDSMEISNEILQNVDVLIMLSPLSKNLQKDITHSEKKVLIDFIEKGGSLILFVDDEHRVNLKKYGANIITKHFGIELGCDLNDIPKNCGAVSFENEIFSKRYEIPYSGARMMKGGIPAGVSLEGGYVHSAYIKTNNGGKLFVAADTMVGQLMGFPDGKRNVFNKMETRWWGKDSKEYIKDLILWSLK